VTAGGVIHFPAGGYYHFHESPNKREPLGRLDGQLAGVAAQLGYFPRKCYGGRVGHLVCWV
jgi:hypothetical protein